MFTSVHLTVTFCISLKMFCQFNKTNVTSIKIYFWEFFSTIRDNIQSLPAASLIHSLTSLSNVYLLQKYHHIFKDRFWHANDPCDYFRSTCSTCALKFSKTLERLIKFSWIGNSACKPMNNTEGESCLVCTVVNIHVVRFVFIIL